MPQPPREWSSEEEGDRGEDRTRDDLRTAIVGMDVGVEEIDEGEGVEVEQDNAEAEEEGISL